MIRLSRKGWNNVLIIATLFMILLFNSTSDFLQNGPAEPEVGMSLFPPEAEIMTLEFGAIKLERIGTGWRLQPAIGASEADLIGLVGAWRNLTISTTSTRPEGQGMVIVIWLAGEASGRVVTLAEHAGQAFIKVDSNWYQVDDEPYNQLVPAGVF